MALQGVPAWNPGIRRHFRSSFINTSTRNPFFGSPNCSVASNFVGKLTMSRL